MKVDYNMQFKKWDESISRQIEKNFGWWANSITEHGSYDVWKFSCPGLTIFVKWVESMSIGYYIQ